MGNPIWAGSPPPRQGRVSRRAFQFSQLPQPLQLALHPCDDDVDFAYQAGRAAEFLAAVYNNNTSGDAHLELRIVLKSPTHNGDVGVGLLTYAACGAGALRRRLSMWSGHRRLETRVARELALDDLPGGGGDRVDASDRVCLDAQSLCRMCDADRGRRADGLVGMTCLLAWRRV